MRVIAGRLRGRRLETVPGLRTRPMTDRAKETTFNILGARMAGPGWLPDVPVLDLFAGSGGMGIEALSRGARSCLFVEHDRRALRTLQQNLATLDLRPAARVYGENAWTMRIPPADEDGYGLAFVDPPYRDAADLRRVLDLLERLGPVMAPDGLVVFRHQRLTRLPVADLRGLACVDERAVGTMRLWFLGRRAM
jgi:16S rRNA (guanine966-N2)-methyltransferase